MFSEVSGQRIGPIFKGQESEKNNYHTKPLSVCPVRWNKDSSRWIEDYVEWDFDININIMPSPLPSSVATVLQIPHTFIMLSA
jgi:hypothetical protein